MRFFVLSPSELFMFDLLLTTLAVLILEPRGAAKHKISFMVYYDVQ